MEGRLQEKKMENNKLEEYSQLFAKDFYNEITRSVESIDQKIVANIALLLFRAKEEGRQIFFFGNGGSHSIATHITCDLGKGTKINGKKDQKFYKVFGLDNSAWLTAQANDGKEPFTEGSYPGNYNHGYDGVFVGQMENFIQAGDIAFGISSSGNSPNVVNALLFAKEKKATTIAMVGFDGGKAAEIADHVILVKTDKGKYGIVEAVHEVIHHYIYELAKKLETI
jgi:D-sedoheptulose 7-phosphate isomerase